MPNEDRRRRIPPRQQNPETAPAPVPAPAVHQLAQIPWLALIITSGVTTLTSYALMELVRATHRSIQRRREQKREEAMSLNPRKPVAVPGIKPGGAFQLPEPGPSLDTAPSMVPYAGFAAPAANSVYSAYPGNPQQMHPQQAQHGQHGQHAQQHPPLATQMNAMARDMHERMARLEEMITDSHRGTG